MWTLLSIIGLSNPLYTNSSIIIGNNVYISLNNNGVYTSPLGQNNWTPFGSGFNNFSLSWSFTTDGTYIFAATTEGIFGCPLVGGSWTERNGNITRARTTIGWVDNNIICAGSSYFSGLKRTANGGATWTNTSLNNQQGLYKRGIKINNKILMPSSHNIFSSTDDGQTWTFPTTTPIPNYSIAKYGNYLIAPSGNKVVYSSDLGVTWNTFSSGIPSNGTVYSVAVMGQSAYAGVNNSVYKMEYPGAPWVNFSQGIQLSGLITNILSIESTLIMSNTSGLFRRTIEDSLWRSVSPYSYGKDLIFANGFLFTGTNSGVYFSDDLGKKFHEWNDGFSTYLGGIESLFADGNELYAGTEQFSAWKRTIEPEISITSAPSTTFCTGSSISVTAACVATLNANNKYYLQLSDRFGRFLNPLILDSIQGISATVTFNTLLPDSLLTGTQYKVRVVSSSPYLLATSSDISFTIIQRVNIKLQPANQNSCQGQGTGFYVGAEGDSLFYQWEVDQTGSGSYIALTNNAIYQNVNSSLLLITNPTTGLNGYRYRCLVTNSCGPVNSNYGILIVSSTNASITNQPTSSTVCSGLLASFSLTAMGVGLSYQWQVNSGFGIFTNISNGSQYSGANSSNLSINITNTNMNGYVYRCKIGNCLFSDSVTLVVNGSPVASNQLSQEVYCDGGIVQFNAIVSGANISYQWEENNGGGFLPITNGPNYSGATSPILQLMNIPASHTNYLYRCNITGQCFPDSSTTNNGEIILTASPIILLQPVNASVCEGDSASFTAIGSGSLLYYQWEMNTGSGWMPVPSVLPYSGENSSTLQISPTTLSMQNYQFRCRMSSCTSSNSATLNLLALPIITTNHLSICSNHVPYTLNGATPNGGIYFGNEIYSGIFNPNTSNTGSYVYNYFYQAPNGCSSSASGNILLSTCTDLQETSANNTGIKIHPNPANSNVTISFIEPTETETNIHIFSGEGRLIEKLRIERQQNFTFNVANYSNGLYLIRVLNKKASSSYRLLVLH
ncbi:MAG: T9SS type A sorting domain-containing protein [Bacteroidetes bacterium]|nr:T9SS type A sorting domain-containing protein [Bacteroidota bacterium]